MSLGPLFIPVILGTARKGRASENVAKFVFGEMQKRQGIETELIDICELEFPIDDAGEAIKDKTFSDTIMRADGLIRVLPEYNHGYPGLLKPCARLKSKGVHTQSRRRLRRVSRRLWWHTSDRERSARVERTGSGDNFLGWQFFRGSRPIRRGRSD